MVKAPFNWWLWTKVLGAGAAISVGGPYLASRLIPTEEELFARYNPDLQKQALEQREQRQQEFDDFTKTLKTVAKSDKNMWIVLDDMKRDQKRASKAQIRQEEQAGAARRQQMRDDAGLAPRD